MGNLFCCIQVDQSTVAFKERFGKFEEVLEPACHFLPWILGYRCAGKLSLRLQQLDVECETKTKDNLFVYVVASVQYRPLVDKAIDAFYRLSNPRSQMETYVISVIRDSVAKLNVDVAYERKNEIAEAVEKELGKAMSDYGYEIVRTLIVDIKLDLSERKAEAEKILQIKRAEGDAKLKKAIEDVLRNSGLDFSEKVPGTTAKDDMDMILVTQYFDTTREICLAQAPLSSENDWWLFCLVVAFSVLVLFMVFGLFSTTIVARLGTVTYSSSNVASNSGDTPLLPLAIVLRHHLQQRRENLALRHGCIACRVLPHLSRVPHTLEVPFPSLDYGILACWQTLAPIAAIGREMRNQDQAIQASVAKLNLGDAFERKNEIAKAAKDEVGKAMSAYGYEIVGILIVGIDPDQRVRRAMLDISIANIKAEAEKIIQIMRAEGEDEHKKAML
ncbi:hypothetical protein NL676_036651 [Syzygium grande]|nr:hypothetical protein NL676_036651 [Syzygium grande]